MEKTNIQKKDNNGMGIPSCVSLCTGYDGIGLGLKQFFGEIRTLCYVEREAFPIANMVAKIKEGKMDDAPIWADIRTFDGKPFKGLVDILHGGLPCQPFSVAGKRQADKDERYLWPYAARIIREMQPKFCFFENVEGHLSLGFREVKQELEELHYTVKAGIFSAEEVGAPHRRKRLFILANAQSRKPRQSEGRNGRKSVERGGKELADSRSVHAKRPYQNGVDGERICQLSRGQEVRCKDSGCCQGWPARPGEPQHDWEYERVIESKLGCSIDGCGSRVDMLRLLGNGVVPQTAAKAWRVLNENRI